MTETAAPVSTSATAGTPSTKTVITFCGEDGGLENVDVFAVLASGTAPVSFPLQWELDDAGAKSNADEGKGNDEFLIGDQCQDVSAKMRRGGVLWCVGGRLKGGMRWWGAAATEARHMASNAAGEADRPVVGSAPRRGWTKKLR